MNGRYRLIAFSLAQAIWTSLVVKVYSLSEVALERRTGNAWYGTWPARILERDYPAWKARLKDK